VVAFLELINEGHCQCYPKEAIKKYSFLLCSSVCFQLHLIFPAKVLIPRRQIDYSLGNISVEFMKMDVKPHVNSCISSLINVLNTGAKAQSHLSCCV
jgi:chorismate mutase